MHAIARYVKAIWVPNIRENGWQRWTTEKTHELTDLCGFGLRDLLEEWTNVDHQGFNGCSSSEQSMPQKSGSEQRKWGSGYGAQKKLPSLDVQLAQHVDSLFLGLGVCSICKWRATNECLHQQFSLNNT